LAIYQEFKLFYGRQGYCRQRAAVCPEHCGKRTNSAREYAIRLAGYKWPRAGGVIYQKKGLQPILLQPLTLRSPGIGTPSQLFALPEQ
jgi:hypothetical protein